MLNRYLELPTLLISFTISFGLVCFISFANISHVPNYDEFYHLVPAISWNQNGTLGLLDGIYDRAASYTVMVAYSLDLFGVSLESARMPSILPGILLIAALFLWVYRQAGLGAATLSTTILSIMPVFVYTLTQSRFYMLHALMISIAGMLIYKLRRNHHSQAGKVTAGTTALIILTYAITLQPSTVIAIAGFSLWLAFEYRAYFYALSYKIKVTAFIISIMALVVGYLSGLIDLALSLFSGNPLWAEKSSGNVVYYIQELGNELGFLWSLLPLMVLMGYRSKHRSLLTFCGIVFLTIFCIHSLASQKSARYVLYGMPFLTITIAILVSELLASSTEKVREILSIKGCPKMSPGMMAMVSLISISTLSLLGVLLEPTLRSNLKNAVAPDKATTLSNWELVMPTIRPLLSDSTVVTTEGIKAAYYLGDYNYELNRSVAFEIDDEENFRIDPRTGRMAIGTLEEMQRVYGCHSKGIIISDEKRWRSDHGLPPEAADFIAQIGHPVSVSAKSHLIVYSWENPAADPKACQLIE